MHGILALLFYLCLFASCCRDSRGQWIVTTDAASAVSLCTHTLCQIKSRYRSEPFTPHSDLLRLIAKIRNLLATIVTTFTTRIQHCLC
jgi:hypothetical protein